MVLGALGRVLWGLRERWGVAVSMSTVGGRGSLRCVTLETPCTSCDPTNYDVKHRAGLCHWRQTTRLTTPTEGQLSRDVWLG